MRAAWGRAWWKRKRERVRYGLAKPHFGLLRRRTESTDPEDLFAHARSQQSCSPSLERGRAARPAAPRTSKRTVVCARSRMLYGL